MAFPLVAKDLQRGWGEAPGAQSFFSSGGQWPVSLEPQWSCGSSCQCHWNHSGSNSLFTDEDSVAPAQVSSVAGASQVGHQLQVVSVFIHKPCDWNDLRRTQGYKEEATSKVWTRKVVQLSALYYYSKKNIHAGNKVLLQVGRQRERVGSYEVEPWPSSSAQCWASELSHSVCPLSEPWWRKRDTRRQDTRDEDNNMKGLSQQVLVDCICQKHLEQRRPIILDHLEPSLAYVEALRELTGTTLEHIEQSWDHLNYHRPPKPP